MRSGRRATFTIFVVQGVTVGTWVAEIPWVQDRLDVSKTALGLILLVMSLGFILGVLVMGQALVRLGTARGIRVAAFPSVLLVTLPLLAPSPLVLPVALLAFGVGAGALDVAMNAHGVHVEKALGRPVMSSLHAGWSLGAFLGAGAVALTTALGLDPRLHGAATAVALALVVTAAVTRLGPGERGGRTASPRLTLPGRSVVLLAFLCFLIMVSEGVIGDWGGIYLRTDLGAQAGVAALAFAALALGMTAGRVAGDALRSAFGLLRVLRWGAALGCAAMAALLVVGQPLPALAGFAIVGFGIANGVPLLFSAAGRAPGAEAGPAISAVSSMGSVGFLLGPPFVGVLADATSLPVALASLCAATGIVVALAGRAVARDDAVPVRLRVAPRGAGAP